MFHKPYCDVTAAARLVKPCSMENGKMGGGGCVSTGVELVPTRVLRVLLADDMTIESLGTGVWKPVFRATGHGETEWTGKGAVVCIVTFASPPLSGAAGNVSRSSSRIHWYAAMGCGAPVAEGGKNKAENENELFYFISFKILRQIIDQTVEGHARPDMVSDWMREAGES